MTLRNLAAAAIAATLCGQACPAVAELYINEMFFDPGGAGDDTRDEYIELRGTPGMSLANHYLILIENENADDPRGSAGSIENIFTLGDDPNTPTNDPYSMGTNGFLTLRQKGSLYAAPPAGTTDLINTGTGEGYGSDFASSIRASDQGGNGITENSGFTAMLIRNNGDPTLNAPFLGLDLDVGNNGLDPIGSDAFGWRSAWTIVDSIGVFSEFGEAWFGRLYANVNFGPDFPLGENAPGLEPDAVYVPLTYEIEYLGRWGNSTGQTPADWHAANLTDKELAGSTGVPDFRLSGTFHDENPSARVETSQGVPYGTKIVDTLGAPNLFYEDGDFNFDGVVDGSDFLIWQRGLGYGDGISEVADETATRADGDTNGDWIVDGADLERWKANFGVGGSPTTAAAGTVPEPGSATLVLAGALGVFGAWRRRQ